MPFVKPGPKMIKVDPKDLEFAIKSCRENSEQMRLQFAEADRRLAKLRNGEALRVAAPDGKDVLIEVNPFRIDGVLVGVEALLHIFRPDSDPRVWSRFERIPSPSHPGEDVITVHTEIREA